MSTIAVVIIVKNEEQRIRACLDQVKKLTGEIVIVDDESSDRTREIAAEEYGARVIVHRSDSFFGRQRNIGIEQVCAPWFMSLDADEVLSDETIAWIKAALASADEATGAFKVKRLNYFFGKPIYHAGEGIYLLKIFRKAARDNGVVHEEWIFDGMAREIDCFVDHYPFTSMTAQFNKIVQYTAKEAQAYVAGRDRIPFKEIRYSLTIKSVKIFWKLYVKKQGYKDGAHGLVFCVLNVLGPAMRWMMIWEEALKCKKLR